MSCSPLRDNNVSNTCFTSSELVILSQAWNNTVIGKKDLINVDFLTKAEEIQDLALRLNELVSEYNQKNTKPLSFFVIPKCYTSTFLNVLYTKFKPFCELKGESCWIDNHSMGNELIGEVQKLYPNSKVSDTIKNFVFKPKGTLKQYGWLSTSHIQQVMKQYEKLYPAFKFIDCIASDHYTLNPKEFPSDKILKFEKSAIIYNLDKSSGPGTHWVAVFIENYGNNNLQVEYFDSTGNPPIKSIKKFLYHNFFCKRNTIYKINKFKHQKGNSECGVFSLFYIQQRLQGKKFEDFQVERFSDDYMKYHRDDLFRQNFQKSDI